MPNNEVDIKIKTSVDGDELSKLNKDLKQLQGEDTKIQVGADTQEATTGLDNVKQKAGDISPAADGASTSLGNMGKTGTGAAENIVKGLNGAENATGNFSKTVASGDGAWSVLSNSANGAIDSILGGLESATSKMSSFLSGLSGADRVIGGVLGAVGVKSINDLTIANAKAADTNKTLMKTMTKTADEATSLWNASDKATNNSLMSMRELVPTMSAFQSQTGANAKQMELFAETAAILGSKSLALGYSSERTATSVMALGNGLEGAYAAVDHLGITEQTLMNTGLWTGKKEDVEGYLNAVQAVTGNIDDLMTTVEGKEKTVYKKLSTAGRKLGEEITPVLEQIYDGFLGINKQTDGFAAKLTVGAAGAVSTFAMIAPQLEASFSVFGRVSKTIGNLRKGADAVSSVAGAAGAGAKVAGVGAQTAELAANTTALAANTAALEANNLARATSMGGAAKGIKGIGAVGSAASGAAPGAAAGGGALSAIGASITSMLIPLIAISAVIAIMIPIVAGLAIEVLLFVRLIGEVVKALAFDKLDLGSSIEGIKQIGLAMWEILKAFTVLTAINVVNVVYTATGGILGTSVALGQFWIAAKEIELVLKEIAKMNIDNSAVTKITQISETIKGISQAMGQLTGLNLSGLGVMLTGGMQAIRQNIRHMTDIGKEIQAINIPSIPKEKTDMINKLAETVKQLSEASKAVEEANGWFQTGVLNYDDVTGMQATLRNIAQIARNINSTQIPAVKEEKVGLVKKLAEVVKPLADAAKAVDDANGDFKSNVLNIDDVEGMQATLRNLGYIATNINATDIPPVDKAKIDAVRNIENVITPLVNSAKLISENWQAITVTTSMAEPFKKAIDAIYSINQHINTKAFNLDSSKIQAISSMKTLIAAVADIGLFISNNTSNLGTHIIDNRDDINNAIGALYSINQRINASAFNLSADKVTAVSNLRPFLDAVGGIGLFISNNKDNLGDNITKNATNINSAIGALYSINQKINSMPFQIDEAKVSAISALQSLIQTINNTLSAGAGVQAAAQNMGSKITTGFKAGAVNLGAASKLVVTNAISAVQNRYATMQSAGNALGAKLKAGFSAGSGISSPMALVVKGMNDTIAHIKGLHGAFYDAGYSLGESFASGMTEEEKENMSLSDALTQSSSSIMGEYYNSGISLGGSAGSPFEENGSIGNMNTSSGSNNTFVFNSLVTERTVVNEIKQLLDKDSDLDAMRS